MFEEFDGGDTGVGVTVIGKFVVEEVDFSEGSGVGVRGVVFKPSGEGLFWDEGDRPFGMEAGEAIEGASDGGDSEEEVPGPGGVGGEALGGGEVGDEFGAEGRAVGVVVLLLELGLHFGHVDGGGAFLFTALAGEAKVEDFAEFVVGERVLVARVGEDVSERVGAGAGAVLFVAGGHVAGAHRAACEVDFAAVAGAVAHLGGAEDSVGGGPIEDGFDLGGSFVEVVAEMSVHRRGVDDLAGIEDAIWVPGAFDLFDEAVVFFADHLGEEFAAEASVAVFAGEGATVFFDEDGDRFGDFAELFDSLGGFEIDDGAEVDFSGAGVGVVDAFEIEAVLELAVEFGDVFGEVGDVDGGVLDDGGGFGVAGHVGHEAEAGFAEVPDPIGVGAEEDRVGVAESGGPHFGFEARGDGEDFFLRVAADFGDEDGSGFALEEEAVGGVLEAALGAVENVVVDQFDGEGIVLDCDLGGAEGLVDIFKMGALESGDGSGERVAVELDFGDEAEGAFAACDELAEVEGFFALRVEAGGIGEEVEGVAGIAAGDGGLGELAGDFGAGFDRREEVADFAVEVCFERIGAVAFGCEFCGGERSEGGFVSIG